MTEECLHVKLESKCLIKKLSSYWSPEDSFSNQMIQYTNRWNVCFPGLYVGRGQSMEEVKDSCGREEEGFPGQKASHSKSRDSHCVEE